MKRAFQMSLLFNTLLGGWILWFSLQPRRVDDLKFTNQPTPNGCDLPQSNQSQPQPGQQFRWSQLESTDYRRYIANLKAIGCPEQTIRDIITADVRALYVTRREQLDRQPMVAEARTAKSQALRAEESSVLLALLGPTPASQPVDDNLQPTQAAQAQTQNNAASIPLAFRPIDFFALNLKEDQLETVQYLRSEFQRELRDAGYDRTSPEYLKQWQSAQAQNDLMLRGMLGTKLYEQIQSLPQTAPNLRQ